MIIDVTKVQLIPDNGGVDCPGNGEHIDDNGILIECCCDECNYMMCCLEGTPEDICKPCTESKCPRGTNQSSR